MIVAMTTPQREYVYAYTEGNYREMVWAILTNRRWMCDYTPKEDFFKWVEKSNNAELKKLWDYVQYIWTVCLECSWFTDAHSIESMVSNWDIHCLVECIIKQSKEKLLHNHLSKCQSLATTSTNFIK